MVSALRDGAWVIANVGGDRAGYTGSFRPADIMSSSSA